MNCCRQIQHEEACQDTIDQVGSILRDIEHQLRHLCYAGIFDEATDTIGHRQLFAASTGNDAALSRVSDASIHALVSVLRRAGCVSSLLGDDSAAPASLLLSASNGLVYFFTRLTARYGLVLVLAENPVDVADATTAFLEGRLRATLNRLVTHFAPP
ncbi:hypothetical protein GMRT_12411 [Giardia muris]|uniref:Uncharacterized protein n=1 Tax=Giardia muris TaxID=5742 RepID=A0A4Z1SN97_GIAMU|nr:hypothetical protein GMRT_12411 [Giardia muris]|eukprot:TNJ27232.1 hypothetical protein GMRT_12411 [Giardia muris]